MKKLFIFVLSIQLLGCFHDPESDKFVDFTIVSSGTQTGLSGQQMRVIKDSTQLSELLSVISMTGDMPGPDYNVNMLVAIFSGSNSGCGDGLTVTSVKNKADTLIVNALVSVPGDDVVCPAFVPADKPYIFIELKRSNKQVSLLIDVMAFQLNL